MTPTLHPYQYIGIEHLRRNPKAALFLDMGLGKTAITLSALEPRHLPALVVAPKRVAEQVWPHERSIWRPDLTVNLVAGSPAQRSAALLKARESDITVISRDNLGDLFKVHGAMRPHRLGFRTLVLDELSGFKGRGTRWKQAKAITNWPLLDHVWGLTGTPAPNGLLDLWAQLYLLDHGERLGTGITKYRSRYFTPGRQLRNGVITEWIIRPGATGRIQGLVEDICLSMGTDGRVQLPPVTHNDIIVDFPKPAQDLFKRLARDMVVNLDIIGDTGVISAKNAAVLTGKLSQVSSGFLYPDDGAPGYTIIHHGKLKALSEIVEGTGSPVLVFYRFRAELERIQKELPGLVHTAKEKDVQARWNAGELPVLAAHPAEIGHGLNLQYGGHTIVWMTRDWDLEMWEQGNKRLIRQGQQHPVVIHALMAPTFIEEAIRDRLEGKATVQQALRNHLERALL